MPYQPTAEEFEEHQWLLLYQTEPGDPRFDLIGEEARQVLLKEFGEDGVGLADYQHGEDYDECEFALPHEASPATMAELAALFSGHGIESWDLYDRAN